VRIFRDTSIFVPAFYGDHVHHDASIEIMDRLGMDAGFCGSPSLVETYSVLTRMPGKYRVTAERARLFIASLQEKVQAVALTESEYTALIDHYAAAGIVGGAIYDAVLARCALKANVEVVLTWNDRDFTRFGPEVARLVKTPAEFQGGA
jgi:predicted nucleic acid-binding protein